MITVACVLVRGHVGFTPDYVRRLRARVAEHLPVEHNFVCLTDHRATELQGIPTLPVRSLGGWDRAWWTKLRLFDSMGFNVPRRGRVLYLDLDVAVVGDLRDVLAAGEAAPDGFAIAPPGGDWKGRGELRTVRRYNSSVMTWSGGSFSDLYHKLDESDVARLWGDQDWIGESCPGLGVMPAEWFPRLSEVADPSRPDLRPAALARARVLLVKKPKNHVAARQYPWLREVW